MESKRERIRLLEELIKKYQTAYYNGEVELSDAEFDLLWDELKSLEPENPVFGTHKESNILSFASEREAKKYFEARFAQGITQEDIEAAREDLHIVPGKVFHIEYKDSWGDISERDIEIQKTTEKNGKIYIYAFCHLRLMVRSFLASNIISMTYEGRQIKDIEGFLTSLNQKEKATFSAADLASLAGLDDGNNPGRIRRKKRNSY
jgi:predicted DNA-binding transcriptional regulator YafY